MLGIALRIIWYQTSHFKAKELEDQKGQHLPEIRSQLRAGPGLQPLPIIHHIQLPSCLSVSLASHLVPSYHSYIVLGIGSFQSGYPWSIEGKGSCLGEALEVRLGKELLRQSCDLWRTEIEGA